MTSTLTEYRRARQLEELRAQLAIQVETAKHRLESQRIQAKTSSETIAGYGRAALRGAFVLNGGAAVALLSQLGSLSNKIGGAYLTAQVTPNLVLFAIGAAVAVAGTFASYWTQYLWAERAQLGREPGLNEYGMRAVAVLIACASIALFLVSVWKVSAAFA